MADGRCRPHPPRGRDALRPRRRRAGDVRALAGEPRLRGRAGRPRRAVRDRGAAAQHHRLAAHGPRAQRLDAGRDHPPAQDAGPQGALDLRHRPRGHRDAERGRAHARARQPHARGARARGVRPARLELARGVGRDDHRSVPAARLLARLRARALHHGSGVRARRGRGVRRAVPARLSLPRQPHDQLVHRLPHGDLRSGGRARRGRRHDVLRGLPARRRRPRDRRDRAPGDAARRHRGRRQPVRRALRAPDRQARDRAAGRARGADRRRRARRSRGRHGRAQGDAGPRSERPRDRRAGTASRRSP